MVSVLVEGSAVRSLLLMSITYFGVVKCYEWLLVGRVMLE